MTIYRQSANLNATNSELDAKKIVYPKQSSPENPVSISELTNVQRDLLIEDFVEKVVDNMSTESLVVYAQEMMGDYLDKLSSTDLEENIHCYDEKIYDQLVNNILSNPFIEVN